MLRRAYRPLAGMGLRYVATHQDEETTRRRVSRGECFVAERQGRIVGTITFEDAAATRGCPYYDRPGVSSIHQFGVEPEFQRCGIGAMLLDHAEARARETGALELALDTAENAGHLIRFYRKRGYRVVSLVAWGPVVNYRSVIMTLELVAGSAITVRDAGEADAPALAAIQELASVDDSRAAPAATGPAFGGSLLFVAESGETVIGFVAVRGDDVTRLVVDPAHRGRGAGRLLLRHARERMGPRAWALVPESEPRARRLYEREGFAVVGVVPDSEPGRPAKAIRMERLGLDPGIHREQYETLRAEPRRWLGALQDIAAAHRLAGRELHVIDAGTNLIAALGPAMILKVFPPCLAEQFESERAALRHLAGRLPFMIPGILAEGSRDGWPYLIMSRVDGENLEEVWPRLDEPARLTLLAEIGAAIRALQAAPTGPLGALEPEWHSFIAGQVDRAPARHRETRLAPHLLEDVASYLARTAGTALPPAGPVILTGEFTPENLTVSLRDGRAALAGVVDFGDCMTGHPEYDLLGPGVFLCEGKGERLRAFLGGYGYGARELAPSLARRLTRLLVLHRYSNLPAQVRIAGWEKRVRTFEELEMLLWPWGTGTARRTPADARAPED